MIVFYGAPGSSAARTHWMLEETGVPFDYKRIDTRAGENKTPEFLALSPGGKIPVLVDEGLVLFESVAINFYLAEKHGAHLSSPDAGERALQWQWSLWAMTNVHPLVIQILYHTRFLPEAQRDPKVAADNREWVRNLYLSVLEKHLEGKEHLVGERFSVADVNAGSVVNLATTAGGVEAGPATRAWLDRLRARPAFKKAYAT